MDSPQVFEAHDSALQELHTLRVTTAPAIPRERLTAYQRQQHAVRMARLVIAAVEAGKLHSVLTLAAAQETLADADAFPEVECSFLAGRAA